MQENQARDLINVQIVILIGKSEVKPVKLEIINKRANSSIAETEQY